MRFTLYVLLLVMFSCRGTIQNQKGSFSSSTEKDSTDYSAINEKGSTDDTNTKESLKVGSTFFKNDAFVNYTFLESEPYEFISFNSEMKSTQLMVFQKNKTKYLTLITASDLVDNVDYDWEKLEKEVNYILPFPKELNICWYISGTDDVGIGTFIEESNDGILFQKEKILKIDYKNGSVQTITTQYETFLCTDGH